MRKALAYACCVLLFAQTAIASSGASFPPAPPKYAKAPLRFSSYGKYLQYNRKKLFEGIDSANVFYKRETEQVAYAFTDYLPLAAGSGNALTGTLFGTGANFSDAVSMVGGAVIATASNSPYSNSGIIYAGSGSNLFFGVNNQWASKYFGMKTDGTFYVNGGQPAIFANEVQAASFSGGGATFTGGLSGTSADFSGVVSMVAGAITVTSSNTPYTNSAILFGGSGNGVFIAVDNQWSSKFFGMKPDGMFYVNGGQPAIFSGNVGIGTSTPSESLSVNGNISTKKLIVTQTGWSDYVFNDNYKLRSLSSLESYLKQHRHLPEIPSANEIEEKGISVGDNQALLLKKIEELTLYVIGLQKQVTVQAKQIKRLTHKK